MKKKSIQVKRFTDNRLTEEDKERLLPKFRNTIQSNPNSPEEQCELNEHKLCWCICHCDLEFCRKVNQFQHKSTCNKCESLGQPKWYKKWRKGVDKRLAESESFYKGQSKTEDTGELSHQHNWVKKILNGKEDAICIAPDCSPTPEVKTQQGWGTRFKELFQPQGTALKYINVNNFVVVEAIIQFISQEIESSNRRLIERIEGNIGFLRQYVNENYEGHLFTNEELELFLGLEELK